MSFERLLSWVLPCEGLLFTRIFSFGRIGISWIPFEIFLSLDNDISYVLMLSTLVASWLFLGWECISKPIFLMFLVSEEIKEPSCEELAP